MPWDVSFVASFLWGLAEWIFSSGEEIRRKPSS